MSCWPKPSTMLIHYNQVHLLLNLSPALELLSSAIVGSLGVFAYSTRGSFLPLVGFHSCCFSFHHLWFFRRSCSFICTYGLFPTWCHNGTAQSCSCGGGHDVGQASNRVGTIDQDRKIHASISSVWDHCTRRQGMPHGDFQQRR